MIAAMTTIDMRVAHILTAPRRSGCMVANLTRVSGSRPTRHQTGGSRLRGLASGNHGRSGGGGYRQRIYLAVVGSEAVRDGEGAIDGAQEEHTQNFRDCQS